MTLGRNCHDRRRLLTQNLHAPAAPAPSQIACEATTSAFRISFCESRSLAAIAMALTVAAALPLGFHAPALPAVKASQGVTMSAMSDLEQTAKECNPVSDAEPFSRSPEPFWLYSLPLCPCSAACARRSWWRGT